jgi:hypothetical protein
VQLTPTRCRAGNAYSSHSRRSRWNRRWSNWLFVLWGIAVVLAGCGSTTAHDTTTTALRSTTTELSTTTIIPPPVSSTSPTSSTVHVPAVVGDTLAEASSLITGAGLRILSSGSMASISTSSGDVSSQSPQAHALVPQGSAVTITIASTPPTTTTSPAPPPTTSLSNGTSSTTG